MTLDLFGGRSTIDDGTRSEGDFYETPKWMTRSLLIHHPSIRGRRVLECCSGRDAIATVLQEEAGCRVFTNDIAGAPAETSHDATNGHYWMQHAPVVDWVVTNLPYDKAIYILPLAIMHALIGVATVLPKNFDEPTGVLGKPKPGDRGEWLNAKPWTRKICLPRHSFRGTGSPSMASDWFIWEKEPDRSLPPCVVDHIAKTRTRCHE